MKKKLFITLILKFKNKRAKNSSNGLSISSKNSKSCTLKFFLS
jgi:hypothetical protein